MCGRAGNRSKHEQSSGFTMVELMLGLAVAGLLAIATFLVLQAQNRAASTQRGQVDSQQNGRAAMDLLVREIRQAGANVDRFHHQAALIDCAPYQMVFNADIRSGVGGDPAMPQNRSVQLSDGTTYAPGDFLDEDLQGLTHFNNGAETVRLGLDVTGDGQVTTDDQDTRSHTAQDFQLLREIDGANPDAVAYGIRGPLPLPNGQLPVPLFQYLGTWGGGARRLWGDTNQDGKLSQSEIQNLTPVTRAELANVRQITITTQVIPDLQKTAAQIEDSAPVMTTTLQPEDIGINPDNLNACGDPPMTPATLTAIDTPDDGGRSITLTLAASFDESNGEKDVTQYSVYRRRVGEPGFGAPIYNLKGTGASSYTFVNDQTHSKRAEDAPEDGVQYEYYLTAWDCEPQESNPSIIAGPIAPEPNGPMPPTLTSVFDTPCDAGGDMTVVFAACPEDVPGHPGFEGYRIYRGTQAGITAYKARVLDVPKQELATYTVHDLTNALLPMSPDSTYYYVVRGVQGGVESVDSNQWGPVFVSDGLARPILSSVQDLPGDFGNRLELQWQASASEACSPPLNVAAYDVQRKSQFETAWSTVHTVTTFTHNSYTWTDTLCIPAVLYSYQIVARGSVGSPSISNSMSARPNAENQLQPPLAFQGQDDPCDPQGAIVLTWNRSPNDPAGEMTHYRIFRGTQPGVYDFELPRVSATGKTSYTLTDGAALTGGNAPHVGVTYYYVARSWNDFLSLQSQPTPEAAVLAESTPTSPSITSASDTPNDNGRSITLRFTASAQDGGCDNSVTAYKIYRGTSSGALGTQVGAVSPAQAASYTFLDDLVYSFDPPQDGTTYFYGVRAFAGALVSKLSNVMGPAVSVRDGVSTSIIFTDDFEIDRGWTHGSNSGTDDWQIGKPLGMSATYGNPDPSSAASGTREWGNALGSTGKGTYSRSAQTWLTSPQVDCTGKSQVAIQFKRWLNVEQPSKDKAEIYVKVGSGGWQRVWRNPAQVTDNGWTDFQLDVSSLADNKKIQVRFMMDSNSSREYTGWNIDNFTVIKQ